MPNLKETRNRIKGVKSTQKITKAMKMVATAKLKKIRDSLIALREYTHEIELLISASLSNLSEAERKEIMSHPLIAKLNSADSPHLIIFNTSNKGLCGGINNQNIKYLKNRISELQNRKHKILIYCVGKKGFDYCNSHYKEYLVNKAPVMLDEKNSFNTENIKNEIANTITEHGVSASSVMFAQFVSTTTQKTTEIHLTPIHASKIHGQNKFPTEYIFDSSKIELIKNLIPEFMFCKILSSVLENATSEQSARMIAMENANNAAGKLIKNLTLIYNRIRQSNITREISEIVSGVESLKQV